MNGWKGEPDLNTTMTTANHLAAEPRWGFPSEISIYEGAVPLRRGASWRFQLPLVLLLLLGAAALAGIIGDLFGWLSHRAGVLVALGGIGCWRWSWFALQSARAVLYRYWSFPRLQREAARSVAMHGAVPEIAILAVTYRENRWITRVVFESVLRELSTVEGLERPAKVVVATGGDADDEAVRGIWAECRDALHPAQPGVWPPELVLLRDDTGKRPAIATALRAIVAGRPHPDGVVVFMDGDTLLQPGLLRKVLPMFRLKPEVSALTTNENGWVRGPRWFAEWISLRFGLRHRTMCSVALSGRLLCLTGRLSVFRGSVAADPTFLQQIERDCIHHWLWDSFEMLSGDDKSTWYWLAARGKRMLYVPDATVTTLEVVTGSALERALANVRRWSGNSLRHSWRAFRLGPRKLGWFCWYSLLDQRLAIWTVLVGPVFALLALSAGRVEVAAGYLLWVMFSRMAHAAISWRHGRRLSAFYLPLQIASDWVIALTKIWVLFHPAKQVWLNRGARTLDTTRRGGFYRARTAVAHYLYAFTCIATVLIIGTCAGFVPVLNDVVLFHGGPARGDVVTAAVAADDPAPVLMFGMETPGGGNDLVAKRSSAPPEVNPGVIAMSGSPPALP
jgi:mannuronan synthase